MSANMLKQASKSASGGMKGVAKTATDKAASSHKKKTAAAPSAKSKKKAAATSAGAPGCKSGKVFTADALLAPSGYRLTEFENEDLGYHACKYRLVSEKIGSTVRVVFRKAHVTPTKVGQFVALYGRDPASGKIRPYSESDADYFVVGWSRAADDEDLALAGQFVFPAKTLAEHDVVRRAGAKSGGKNAFRLYAPTPAARASSGAGAVKYCEEDELNAQAKRTFKWQKEHFLHIETGKNTLLATQTRFRDLLT
eukprot:g3521.t1